MTLPRGILHIGTEKTGTTSIQRCLGTNRAALKKEGFLYPVSPADRYHNHTKLAAYAREDGQYDDLRRSFGVGNRFRLKKFRKAFEAKLKNELRTCGNEIHTVVFSNEHCHSRLKSATEVSRLVELLRPLVSDLAIVVYLRRQDQMAVSLYSTHLKLGGTDTEIFPPKAKESSVYYNLENLLNRWEKVCGRDSVEPRIYEATNLNNGDVLRDFLDVIGFTRNDSLNEPARSNESFNPRAQAIVREINSRAKLGDNAISSVLRRQIVNFVVSRSTGQGRRPSREQAMAFCEIFRASNERLRQKWFPERTTLFSNDFTNYPDDDDSQTIDSEDAAKGVEEVLALFDIDEETK